ncbi:hypothetical protein [Lentibacillus sediminis]|uniref:hypothetical protein n=1 Tax=Lentibacillus sediminis TaxID=1940529 RepID=UPI000C1BBFB0|nr:hypothetical protein [Lentibacillus sediminis]
MRAAIIFTAVLGLFSILFKWRYRIMNTILAVSVLRRLAVTLSMNMPALKDKLLPALFTSPKTKA